MKKNILFIVVSILVNACGPSEKAIQTSKAETQSAISTATSTSTPEPTAKLTQMAIATKSTVFVDAYSEIYRSAMIDYTGAYSSFVGMYFESKDTANLQDEEWISDALDVVDDLKTKGEAFEELPDPPDGYEEIHQVAMLIAKENAIMVENARNGLILEDYGLLLGLIENIQTINTYFENFPQESLL